MVSRQRRHTILAALYSTPFLITGCTILPKAAIYNPTWTLWRGRLAVRVDASESEGPARSVSAGFELTGNATEGGLTLYTPIGSTAAVLTWTQHDASLLAKSELRHFPSLDALITQVVGTDIPVEALFAWLAGTNFSAAGWTADLTDHANGRITANRTDPRPSAEIRIVLER